jgi:prevent-host-death family protein
LLIVGVREAKDRMAERINRALAGEDVTITRRGTEVARIEALGDKERVRLREQILANMKDGASI